MLPQYTVLSEQSMFYSNVYGAVEKLVRQLSDGRVGWTKRSIKWLVCLTLPRARVSEAQDHIILGLRR